MIGVFFQAEDGIRDLIVTGVQTWALPIFVEIHALVRSTRGVTPKIRAFLDFVGDACKDQIGRASCRERV